MESTLDVREGGGSTAGAADPGPGDSCEALLEACSRAAGEALDQLGEGGELARTVAELRLLCSATGEALALRARTSRELRLICAAICHLCAEECRARPEPWAQRLAAVSRLCAHACRQIVALTPRAA